jgi:hypothetical protein
LAARLHFLFLLPPLWAKFNKTFSAVIEAMSSKLVCLIIFSLNYQQL